MLSEAEAKAEVKKIQDDRIQETGQRIFDF
jgi:hypothetical protein